MCRAAAELRADLVATLGEKVLTPRHLTMAQDLDSLVHLQAKGIPVGADGTLVLWQPKVDEGSPAQKLGRAIRPLSRILLARAAR